MKPHDEIEQLLADAPLALPDDAQVERVRRRIAGAKMGSTESVVWQRRIALGYAAAACLVVGLLSAATTAWVMRSPAHAVEAGPTTAPYRAAPSNAGRQPQFVIRTDFFSRPANEPREPQVDITQWTTRTRSEGESR